MQVVLTTNIVIISQGDIWKETAHYVQSSGWKFDIKQRASCWTKEQQSIPSGIGLFGIVFEWSSEVVGLKIFYPYSKLTNEFFSHPVQSVSNSLFLFVREPKVYVVPASTTRHNTVCRLTELKLFQPIRSEEKLNFLTEKSLQCSSLPFVLPLQPPRWPLHHQTRRLSVFFFFFFVFCDFDGQLAAVTWCYGQSEIVADCQLAEQVLVKIFDISEIQLDCKSFRPEKARRRTNIECVK